MPDVVLFGATGYTGRLTAAALGKRSVTFTVAGRNPAKLEALAEETGASGIAVAEVGDVDALADALGDARVLVTCVGPFGRLGETAVTAALRTGTHYIDSTGEGAFIDSLFERDAAAKKAGIAMASALGFDEVPMDVAASLAVEGMEQADLTLTYAFPRSGSNGTLRSMLDILSTPGSWLVDGRRRDVRMGAEQRWAPMPPPLGPRRSLSLATAETRLAPRHLDLRSCRTYVTAGTWESLGLRYGIPLAAMWLRLPATRAVVERLLPTGGGPDEEGRREKWTVLAEATDGRTWRNVAMMGRDVYGLTGETLAASALVMADAGYDRTGVLAPVEAIGRDNLQKELIDLGVVIEVYEPS